MKKRGKNLDFYDFLNPKTSNIQILGFLLVVQFMIQIVFNFIF